MKLNISLSLASPVLFHYTGLSNLINILKSNEFLLTTGMGTNADGELGSSPYYLSCTRTRLGKYHSRYPAISGVLLTLDGDKLNQRYKTKPVDYWGPEYRKDAKGAYEEEDRLFSKLPTIKNARSYILNIDILVSHTEITKGFFGEEEIRSDKLDDNKNWLRTCVKLAKVNKIPIHLYGSRNDWLTHNVKREVKFEFKQNLLNPHVPYEYEYIKRSTNKEQWENEYKKLKRPNLIKDLLLIHKLDDYNKLTDHAQKWTKKITHDWMNEQFTQLKNDIHNSRTGDDSRRRPLNELIKILSKEHLTLKQFYDNIVSKWQKILNGESSEN